MRCYQILFSPTGGTEKVAAAITQNWPEVQTIDLSSTSTDFASFFIESDSLALVAMPSFGDVAPQLAIDRFAQINGNRAEVRSCGSIWESRLWEYACSNGGYCKCRWLSGDCRHFCHCRTFNYSRICRRSSQCRRLQTTLCIRYQNF